MKKLTKQLNTYQVKRLLTRVILTRLLPLILVFVLTVSFLPIVHKVFATSDFTVSNLTFDPTTGFYSFDYTGTDISSGSNAALDIYDTGGTTEYWMTTAAQCTSSHCTGSMAPTSSSDSGVTQVEFRSEGSSHYVSQNLDYPFPGPTTYSPQTPSGGLGWTPAGETWTYASADSPSFTFTVSGDDTSKYSPGMRVKLTQSGSTKYFLVTAVSYSSPNTTITLYGGTDYTLANATISNPFFSTDKMPQGFPLDPAKWTVQTEDTNERTQSAAAQNTWYTLNHTISLTIPVGSWNVTTEYLMTPGNDVGKTVTDMAGSLSTSTSSPSDSDWTTFTLTRGATGSIQGGSSVTRSKSITLTSDTTYYLIFETIENTSPTLDLHGDISPTIIRATSAYL